MFKIINLSTLCIFVSCSNYAGEKKLPNFYKHFPVITKAQNDHVEYSNIILLYYHDGEIWLGQEINVESLSGCVPITSNFEEMYKNILELKRPILFGMDKKNSINDFKPFFIKLKKIGVKEISLAVTHDSNLTFINFKIDKILDVKKNVNYLAFIKENETP